MNIKNILKLNKKNQPIEGGFVIDSDFADTLPENNGPEKTDIKTDVFEWLDVVCVAVISVVILFSLIFRVATISGDSMLNTLIGENKIRGSVGDRVIITNLGYEPKNGDIVVISRNAENTIESQQSSAEPIIKRVIAVGGQTVDIDFEKGIVYVDGKALKEDYTSSPTVNKYDVEFPVYVPDGYIFVLGDNRAASLDSRNSAIGENGLVDTRYVLGHAIYRIFPFDRIGGLD